MYNALSADYDRFVNWQNRLSVELPFILKHLQGTKAQSVLDAATGTGIHAIALAQLGYLAAGADLSGGMIERARQNAASADVQVHFEQAGFGSLAQVFGPHSVDAILCLGNSLPHLLSAPDVELALHDFSETLKPGGILLIQNRNFDAIMHNHDRWMSPQSHSEGNEEWVFQRFYDFDPDELITFNMITLHRTGHEEWSQKVTSSRLRPLMKDELALALSQAGFTDLETFGGMDGAAFNPQSSPNLVIFAKQSS